MCFSAVFTACLLALTPNEARVQSDPRQTSPRRPNIALINHQQQIMSVIGIIRRRSNEISCVALQHFDASCVCVSVSRVTHIFIQISIKMAVNVVTVGPLSEPVSGFILAPHTSTCTVKTSTSRSLTAHDPSCMLSPWLLEAAVTGSTCHTEMQEPVELCCGPEPRLGEAAVLSVCTLCHHSQSRAVSQGSRADQTL